MFSRNSLIGFVIAIALSAGYAWLNSTLLKDAKAPAKDEAADQPNLIRSRSGVDISIPIHSKRQTMDSVEKSLVELRSH